MTATVALIGAGGHGRTHRRVIAQLQAEGVVRLTGLCDVAPVEDAPPGVPVYRDHRALLAERTPDLVVVCTPPHTHLPIASDALRGGSDVLLEKPPLLDVAEHRALLRVLAETGRACQVGFQALASPALAELVGAIDGGVLGRLETVAAIGAWKRDDSYYNRGAWVGRTTVDGVRVLDGALANPFAHAVMQVLAIVDRSLMAVEVERYRTRDMQVDDTATLRLHFDGDVRALVGVTLCAEQFVPGLIAVTGTDADAVLEYPTDRLRLPGESDLREVAGRGNLLANLAAHRADPAVKLVAALSRTSPFTEVLDVITASPVTFIDPPWVQTVHDTPHPRLVIAGINDALERAGRGCALFSELGLPWSDPTHRTSVTIERTLH